MFVIVSATPASAATVMITIATSPTPLTSSITVDGTTYTSPQTFTWTTGSVHTIAAVSPKGGPSGTQYVWTSWSDAGAQSHSVTTPAVDTTYTATYKTQYFLTVSGGSGGSNGQGWYDAGTTGTATSSGTYTRASGTGKRVMGYNVDGGTNTPTATSGVISVSPTMNAPHTVNFNSINQYQLTLDTQATSALSGITAPPIAGDNYWYDTGTQVTYTGNGVFARSLGTGSRVSTWFVDSGAATNVLTALTFSTTPISMIAVHTVHLTVVTQYQVTLDVGATAALQSITSPTVANDRYWYDTGTAVKVDLNGVSGRANGAGTRLKSYSINGGTSTAVSTTGTVEPLNLASITSIRSITTITTTQYQLVLDAGAGGAVSSITSPSVQGDNYWYDSGTSVTYVGNGVFARTAGAGSRVSSWWWDSASPTSALTSGTFTPGSVSMTATHTIHTTTVAQYQLTLAGTYSLASVTVPTIPSDNYWYDSGASVSLTLNGISGRSQGTGTRTTSFSINGGPPTATSTAGSVNVLTSFSMTSPQAVTVASAFQYQVSLDQVSSSALNSITPPTLNGDTYWYDSGTSLVVRLNGVWGRSSGSGNRLASYSTNAGPIHSVASTAPVSALNISSLKSPQAVQATEVMQFYLSVSGGESVDYSVLPPIPGDTGWYDASTSLKVASSGVYGRASGTGYRLTSWSVDGGASTSVATTRPVTTPVIIMDKPHSVSFNTARQYQITLDPKAQSALSSITPPTLDGDSGWYDGGTIVNVVLKGVWGRGSGSGDRLASFSVDNGPSSPVATTGSVTALPSTPITSPHSVTASTISQFSLVIKAGSIASMTPPSIQQDAGWYDSGTNVVVAFRYVANETTGQSRSNTVGYALDGGDTTVPRSGQDTFSVSVTMNAPHSLAPRYVVQDFFQVAAPPGTSFSLDSPTGDSWYDGGSAVSLGLPYTWGATGDGTRESLVSYSVDGVVYTVQRSESGRYTTSPVVFNSSHKLFVNPVTQYLVTLTFTDASGSRRIAPSSFQADVEGFGTATLQGTQLWSDAGKTVTVSSVNWEGTVVGSVQPQSYRIGSPLSLTVPVKVYNAVLRAVDQFGIPVSGATAVIQLANGTIITRQTAADGTVDLPMIPLGTFKATVTDLGSSIEVKGDASVQSEVTARMVVSVPLLVASGIVIVAIVSVLLLLPRIRRSLAPKRPILGPPTSPVGFFLP